jgi:hypothetical protein
LEDFVNICRNIKKWMETYWGLILGGINMISKKEKSENRAYGWILIFLIVFVIIAMAMPISIFYYIKKYGSMKISDDESLLSFIQGLGPIGDFFAGSTVPLLTFAGFFLLVITTLMQKQELNLTRKEFRESQKIINEQSKTMKLERFENTFFQWMSLHNEIVKGLTLKNPEIPATWGVEYKSGNFIGREALPLYKEVLFSSLIHHNAYGQFRNDISGLHQLLLYIRNEYSSFFNNHRQELGHYFRNLFRFIKFIEEYNDEVISTKEKGDYVDILRAQLSQDEQFLLLYNCLSQFGEPFYKYIKKYDLLDGILEKELVHDPLLIELYNKYEVVREIGWPVPTKIDKNQGAG